MTKNNKNIIIGVVVLVLIALIAAIVSAYAKNKKASDPNYQPFTSADGKVKFDEPGKSDTTTPSLDLGKKIGFGSRGNEVKALQAMYNAAYPTSTKLVVDGVAGSKTVGAIVKVMGFGVLSTSLSEFSAKLNATTPKATIDTLKASGIWFG